MGGFLSAYSGTHRIEVGGGYWIEVKECLAAFEKQRAEIALMGTPTVDAQGKGSAQMNMPAFHTEMLVHSIVGWNLNDDDGSVWALAPAQAKRANIARLPGPVFDQVYEAIDKLNGPQGPGERAQFRDAGGVGDPDGHAGAGVPVHVLGGAGAVEAPGAAPGGPGDAPVA